MGSLFQVANDHDTAGVVKVDRADLGLTVVVLDADVHHALHQIGDSLGTLRLAIDSFNNLQLERSKGEPSFKFHRK